MYITGSFSAYTLLRASRARLYSSSLSSSFKSLSPSLPPKSASPSLINHRSLSSTAARSLWCSVPRWSHRLDWRSTLSLRAQIRAVAPAIERLERKFATMGIPFSLISHFVGVGLFLICYSFFFFYLLQGCNRSDFGHDSFRNSDLILMEIFINVFG